MLSDIIQNWKKYCTDDNFIGIGSTRKVYRAGHYVVKVHLHSLGYQQSRNEAAIYRAMEEQGWSELFAKTYYVDERISIQPYYQALELRNQQSYEID